MVVSYVSNVPSIFKALFEMIKECTFWNMGERDMFYFRAGGRNNFKDPGAEFPSFAPPIPSIYRDGLIEHESDIFNEALRTFPSQFKDDKTTFEILTRMQHYGYATRLLDVTPKITTALAMVLSPDDKGEQHIDEMGFIHVYRVRRDKIKYSTGDTVTALSNLARIKSNHVRLDDLSYLAHECQNERAGFIWKKSGDRKDDLQKVSEKLDNDIKKVWCVRPVINNPRIDFQVGEFFLFGCLDRKAKLDASFKEYDYDDPYAATEGIARIGVLAVSPEAKEEANQMSLYLDVGVERIYPDFHFHSQVINERFKR